MLIECLQYAHIIITALYLSVRAATKDSVFLNDQHTKHGNFYKLYSNCYFSQLDLYNKDYTFGELWR